MEDHWDPGSDSFGAVTPERGSFFSQTGGNDEATQAKVPAAQARAAASEAKKDSSIPMPSLSMDAPDITNSNPTPGSSRLSTSATVARPEYDDEERECPADSLVTRPGYFLVVAAAPLPASNYQKAAWPGYEATQQR